MRLTVRLGSFVAIKKILDVVKKFLFRCKRPVKVRVPNRLKVRVS